MSEADWLTATSVSPLLAAVTDLSERKHKLFNIACCRWALEWVEDPDLPDVIDVCERAVDSGRPTRWPPVVARLERRLDDSAHGWHTEYDHIQPVVEAVASLLVENDPPRRVALLCYQAVYGHMGDNDLAQADLVREVFGNPFRPVAFDPTWRTTTVDVIATGVYADRAFDRLPVLADALEDAGCDSPELLAHLRGLGPHVRGCWALDLVLGKS